MNIRYQLTAQSRRTVRAVRADIANLEGVDPLTIPLERVARRLVAMAPDMATFQGMARQGQASGHLGYSASQFYAAARELTRGDN